MTTLSTRALVARADVTATVTVAGLSAAAPTTVISLPSFTYRAKPYLFEFFYYAQNAVTSANALTFLLFEDSTDVGRLCRQTLRETVLEHGNTYRVRLTPTAGARVFSVRAYTNVNTYQLLAAASRTSDGAWPIQMNAYQLTP